MNYLAHFFIDHESSAPYYNAGLILPDLAHGYIHTFSPQTFDSDAQNELLRGCRMHHQRDKQFHASDFFKTRFDLINEQLKTHLAHTHINRKWFLAHVLLELLIDRILVRHFPLLTDEFYASLDAVKEIELRHFLDAYRPADGGNGILKYFQHFRSARFIGSYADNNLFVYSLSRIMRRAGLPELSWEDKLNLRHSFMAIEEQYFSDVVSLIIQLKQVFK